MNLYTAVQYSTVLHYTATILPYLHCHRIPITLNGGFPPSSLAATRMFDRFESNRCSTAGIRYIPRYWVVNVLIG